MSNETKRSEEYSSAENVVAAGTGVCADSATATLEMPPPVWVSYLDQRLKEDCES